ncbi:hypothetical protein QJQ45_030077 [Haematococcus lacustris]|nr:hypothetical protein QJQ45_030077 [Haematococcus lacustris]
MSLSQPIHQHRTCDVTNYSVSLRRYRQYADTVLAKWPVMWAELSKPRWFNAKFPLYGGKQRTVAKFRAEEILHCLQLVLRLLAVWLPAWLHGACGRVRGATTGLRIRPCTRLVTQLAAGWAQQAVVQLPCWGFQSVGLVALRLFSWLSQGCWPYTGELTRLMQCSSTRTTLPRRWSVPLGLHTTFQQACSAASAPQPPRVPMPAAPKSTTSCLARLWRFMDTSAISSTSCIYAHKAYMATARLNAHRVMARKGSGKHKKDPGKKQKGACPQPTVSSVSYALCDNPSLLLVPSQRLVPLKASNDRSVGMAGPRADVRCRPRLMCPRTVCVPALCLGLSKWQLRLVMQVIKVPEGAVLRGCKETRRKLREHLRLRAKIHSQLRFIYIPVALHFSTGVRDRPPAWQPGPGIPRTVVYLYGDPWPCIASHYRRGQAHHQALKTNENPARVGRLEDFPCSLEQYCDRGEDLLGLNAHFHNWLQGSPHYPITMVSATRPAGWKPTAGQVEPRLVRPAWSQQRDQPVRGLMWCPVVAPRKPPQAPRSSQAATQPAASEPGPSTPPPAKRSKPAAKPTQPTKGKGKAAKAKPAPQPGRWLDRDCNIALIMQRIGESRWRPLELCYWPDQGALPAKGKEYPGLGYKRLRDQPPKAQQQQQQQQPAEAQYESLWDPAVALELLRRCCSHKADMQQVQIWTQEWCQARRQRTSQAPCSSQAATPAAASEPGPSTPPPAKRSKPAAEPSQPTKGTGKGQGKAARAKPAPQPGRWLDRDCNAALNMQRIGESRWRPLELCYWPNQGALPAKGKEYPGLGYKRLGDKPPKAEQQQQQQPVAHRGVASYRGQCVMPGLRAAASPDGAASGQTAVVEICIDSVASAEHARQGGAQRVELCANLHEGGVTPSAGMIKMVRQAFPPPGQLMVLIRCRGGDFLYFPEELLVMQEDIEVCSQLGADGVVLGCLTATGEVDSDATATLMRTALIKGLQVTFHRAFDLCRDMSAALQQLVRLGVQRVLTSGGKPSALALQGAGMIAQLVGEAGHDIIVVAGGGLTEENVEEVVRRSGVLEVHSTAKRAVFSKMAYKRVGMSLCSGQLPSDYAWGEAEGGRVAALLEATQKAVAALPGHA